MANLGNQFLHTEEDGTSIEELLLSSWIMGMCGTFS